jgi:hypothetical protein
VADDNTPLVAADASSQALVENAQRLGLKWDLRAATVVSLDAAPKVIVDGDTTSITATQIAGGGVYLNQRVYVLIIPPSGVFIISAPPFTAKQVLSATRSSVTLQIPINMKEVEIGYQARCDGGGSIQNLNIRIDGNGANVYSTEITQGNAGVTGSSLINNNAAQAFVGQIPSAGTTTGIFGSGKIWFQNWGIEAVGPVLTWTWNNALIAGGGVQQVGGGIYAVVGPYASITFIPGAGNFIAGSVFYAKGIVI